MMILATSIQPSAPVVEHTLSPTLAATLSALCFALAFHFFCILLLRFFWF